MSNPSYIDKALKRVQDGERRAYMRLRTHLGLSPLPSRPSAPAPALSAAMPVEAPPPILARNLARGQHYTGNHDDAASCNVPLNEAANVAEKRTTSRDKEAQASRADYKENVDAKEKSNAIMDDLSDAIGQALDEWKDASNHK
ncbi:hypothetical protein TGAM01_v206380 [Trichoderma gamsii]|uniref:Uncharacterized protein n=1 Tax=Trichoderma gamsii TaxID=398673 RepID=A0A2P4ZKQ5_9HYPO|nr:hypothetical protein TGAM01_v206380 [Trichoderma gamsii]PON24872.1 hypothetical protein TGAM01_v206380 [Trichoderma gamsii]